MPKIKYIDKRDINIPRLKHYKGGRALPYGDNILEVTETEKKHLMKMRNGNLPCWEEVIESRRIRKEIEIEE